VQAASDSLDYIQHGGPKLNRIINQLGLSATAPFCRNCPHPIPAKPFGADEFPLVSSCLAELSRQCAEALFLQILDHAP
jgi:hypothetical protein